MNWRKQVYSHTTRYAPGFVAWFIGSIARSASAMNLFVSDFNFSPYAMLSIALAVLLRVQCFNHSSPASVGQGALTIWHDPWNRRDYAGDLEEVALFRWVNSHSTSSPDPLEDSDERLGGALSICRLWCHGWRYPKKFYSEKTYYKVGSPRIPLLTIPARANSAWATRQDYQYTGIEVIKEAYLLE
jgi:hypothetical protein